MEPERGAIGPVPDSDGPCTSAERPRAKEQGHSEVEKNIWAIKGVPLKIERYVRDSSFRIGIR